MFARSENRSPKILLGCGTLQEGHGGISAVSRMMLRSLSQINIEANVISLLDEKQRVVSGFDINGMAGSKTKFYAKVLANTFASDHAIYDHVGLARAHPTIPLNEGNFSVWIHGVEVSQNISPARIGVLKKAKCILVNSKRTVEKFEADFFPIPNARICPLATENIREFPIGHRKPESQTVGILSRICDDGFMKGHLHLIKAWEVVVRQLPSAKLVIAGEGSGLNILREFVAKSSVSSNIEILGRIDGVALENFWSQIDVFAMPSRVEGFGLVYVEAMQRAKPVIASVHDAGNEINLHGVTGQNVSLEDPRLLADAIINLLSNAQTREKMARSAYLHWRQNYQFANFHKRFLEILNNDILK